MNEIANTDHTGATPFDAIKRTDSHGEFWMARDLMQPMGYPTWQHFAPGNTHILIAKGAMRNTPYQQYMHHFAVKAYEFERSNGDRATSYTTRVQPSGIPFISRKLGIAIREDGLTTDYQPKRWAA